MEDIWAITGSRSYDNKDKLFAALDMALQILGKPKYLVSGGASGADSLAETWAQSKQIPVKSYEITNDQWQKYGKAAGPIRNSQMIKENMITVLFSFPGGKGTADMTRKCLQAGIKVFHITA